MQGMSSSLPEDVQVAFYHTIPGLEHAQILRTAYAIEYDCCDPLQLSATLEFRDWPGLYGAGQFNGSSGYEEAAAQGLVAGINAARKVQGKEPAILDRASSYIGTLIMLYAGHFQRFVYNINRALDLSFLVRVLYSEDEFSAL